MKGKVKVLKLKKQFQGKIATLETKSMGTMKFDTQKIPSSEYRNYEKLGFGYCFDEIEQDQKTEDVVNELREVMALKKVEEVSEEEDEDEDDLAPEESDEDEAPAKEEKVEEIVVEVEEKPAPATKKPASKPKAAGTKRTGKK
mgnify:CR=1 FL=1|tara:strand:- start:1478 stop:1906 length:429 start_codon:yes stop_codon:yes gene_type:complete